MTWLDRVLAVPLLGIRFKPSIVSQATYIEAISGCIDEWHDAGRNIEFKPKLGIDFNLEVNDGFTYAVTADSIVVSFSYRGQLIEPPGEIPQLSYSTPAQSCSALVERVKEETIDFCKPIMESISRPVNRIGFLVDCRIDANESPPGIAEYMRHLATPWSTTIDRCNSSVTVILNKEEEQLDRCHHTLVYDSESNADDVKFKLDWQRYYKPEKAFTPKQLSMQIDTCIETALEYFQKVGMGDLEYGDGK